MRRRDFIGGVGAVALFIPGSTRGQEPERTRRVAVLMNQVEKDPVAQSRFKAFAEELRRLGWIEGKNLSLSVRWGAPDIARFRRHAAELVAIEPDVILASSGATMPAIREATRTVPVVFALVPDPVGSGFVESMAKPGGNATGFTQFEFGLSGKWLEILKELAPSVKRVAVLRDPVDPAGTGQFGAIRTSAPPLGVELIPIDVRDPAVMERSIKAFAGAANGGIIVTGSAPAAAHRKLIISLADRYRLPAVYAYGFFARDGGLVAYGPNLIDQYRQAAGYVDRILKGEKPADLPVQSPTEYFLVVNLRTAKALGITVPQSLLTRANEVIE
jgi:putative ABC transport system substrate-binding protein